MGCQSCRTGTVQAYITRRPGNVQGNSSKVWIVTYTAIVYIYIIVSNIYLHALLHIQVISGPEFIMKNEST